MFLGEGVCDGVNVRFAGGLLFLDGERCFCPAEEAEGVVFTGGWSSAFIAGCFRLAGVLRLGVSDNVGAVFVDEPMLSSGAK